MSVYFDDNGTIKKGYMNHSNRPVLFGYVDDNGTMKKFYDFAEAVEKIIVYPQFLFRDPSTPYMENAVQVNIADLSGYGSISVGSNYIQIVSNRNNSSIWVMVEAEIKFKSYNGNYGFYPLDTFCGYNKRFAADILKYGLSVTGYVFYRSSTSQTSYAYALNSCFGVDIANCSASTSSTVTKTFNENNEIPFETAFSYIGAGRQSGSQNITSKITFNSFSFNGVSIPIVVENRLS